MTCVHRWIVEAPVGGLQAAQCRNCHTDRVFDPFAREDGRKRAEQAQAALGKARAVRWKPSRWAS